MATRFHYKQIIIGRHYTEAMAECGQNRIFEKRDSPEKWGMSCFAPRVAEGVYDDGADNKTSFWNIGFVSDKFGELSLFPSMVGKNFAWCITPSPYWFCRTRKWMPYWGEATTQRAALMTDIRTFWRHKWYDEIIPEIKNALVEITLVAVDKHGRKQRRPALPKDVIDFVLPEYFEYPYEIKSI